MAKSIDTAALRKEAYALRQAARHKLKELHKYNGTPRLFEERDEARRLFNEAIKIDDRIRKLKSPGAKA